MFSLNNIIRMPLMRIRWYKIVGLLLCTSGVSYVAYHNGLINVSSEVSKIRRSDTQPNFSLGTRLRGSGINTIKMSTTISNLRPTATDTSDFMRNQTMVMRNRKSWVKEKCQQYSGTTYWKTLQPRGNIWSYGSLNYCIIPKVGCTFWKRILRFLSKDYARYEQIRKPSDIDKAYVHYGRYSNIRQTPAYNPIARNLFSKNIFMFTRNPYARLWSAYIDKFLLPDFWYTDGQDIIELIRPDGSEYERHCASDITFNEFLMYINMTSRGPMNEHWERIHWLCSPCHMTYDVIGKLETFSDDSEYILKKNHLQYLQDSATKLDKIENEVITLVQYNFELEYYTPMGCFNRLDVAQRLWTAFQYNGYIHKNTEFPQQILDERRFLPNPIEVLTDVVMDAIHHQINNNVETRTQKSEMMLDAYRNVPSELLEEIAEIYKYDFELFGYDEVLFK